MAKINQNIMLAKSCKREGGKVEVNIAQAHDLFKAIKAELSKFKASEILALFGK